MNEKNKYVRAAAWCLLALFALALGSCDGEQVEGKSRTVVVYVSAQNTLTRWMTRDSTELWRGAQRMPKQHKLVVFMDTGDRPAIYVLTSNGSRTTQPAYRFAGKVDSSDPRTLTAVLNWAKANAPADEYALVMASHADGWLPSRNTAYEGTTSQPQARRRPLSWGIDSDRQMSDYKEDGTSGTQMNTAELGTAIEQAGVKLKYIFFDACLMQGLEVAYDLRRAADYMIGSPMYIPAAGAFYENMVPRGLFAADPTAIAKQYMADVTDPKNAYADNYSGVGMVISVLDLSQMDALAEATRTALAHSALAGQEPDLTGVQSYLAFRGYPFFHDAGMAMARIVPPAYYADWRKAFDRVVIYKAATSHFLANASSSLYYEVQKDYTGVSAFVPQEAYNTTASASSWGNHNTNFRATAWYTKAGWAQIGW